MWERKYFLFHFKNKRVVKLNEEKNNICLMHFRGAFGVIRTEKKK